ncbi:1-acyl-sn-glycerol-3-phosphate acyltransferase [bacterium]|nr:1-acyl-sn-glycerol-3-phosphate acyltransferase [bacterium]MDD5918336.1 lysophospholipid acyltransferase family protein [bacterium]
MLYLLIKWTIGQLILLVTRPIVYGRQNLRVKGKAIFIANHRSMWDPLILALVSPRNIHFMAKKELFESKVGNFFFRSLFAFPVNRRNVDLQSLKNALKVLDKGEVFGIFPEGKRAVTDSLDEFEKGAAFLAIRSGAPVIPIYIHPDTSRQIRPVMLVGKPIDVSSIVATANKSSLIDVVTDELSDSIDALRSELEELYCG